MGVESLCVFLSGYAGGSLKGILKVTWRDAKFLFKGTEKGCIVGKAEIRADLT